MRDPPATGPDPGRALTGAEGGGRAVTRPHPEPASPPRTPRPTWGNPASPTEGRRETGWREDGRPAQLQRHTRGPDPALPSAGPGSSTKGCPTPEGAG